jgi:hypothetical protein
MFIGICRARHCARLWGFRKSKKAQCLLSVSPVSIIGSIIVIEGQAAAGIHRLT